MINDLSILQPLLLRTPLATHANVKQRAANTTYYSFGPYADKVSECLSWQPESVLIRDLGADVKVIKPIPVRIRKVEDSFIASFDAANAHVSGETWNESVSNLQYFLIDLFDNLESHRFDKLGPAPRRQLKVLQSFLNKKR